VATPYELTVEWGPARDDWELEPNDTPETANHIEKEGAVEGRLASADDEDWFRVTVPAGSYVDAEVEGIDGLDIQVLVGPERRRVDEADVGDDEELEATAGPNGKVLIGVAEQGVRKPGKKAAEPERDEPYTLKIKLRPLDQRGR
jgi:hypothetical protein